VLCVLAAAAKGEVGRLLPIFRRDGSRGSPKRPPGLHVVLPTVAGGRRAGRGRRRELARAERSVIRDGGPGKFDAFRRRPTRRLLPSGTVALELAFERYAEAVIAYRLKWP